MKTRIANKNQLKYIAEFGLIGAISEIKLNGKPPKNGRLKGKLERLRKLVSQNMAKYEFTLQDVQIINSLIKKLQKETGWGEDERHTCTYVNFCLAFMDQSKIQFDPKLWETLQDIEDYYSRAKKAPAPSLWSADRANRKWQSIWGNREDEDKSSEDRLQSIDAELAREQDLNAYWKTMYPEIIN